ncbi:hypothetical protein [Rhodalgimonas zhirmunskyi]|uniref:Uncharacterized protein n=1 Tax=Rhodalgimonas zhirmunskyi TaxID=2964767 RepID=A0AAJ1U443_9RHOB|nr:hypothetical protein [Rhodoalgimonas zhirmunskyi]MDQ2093346.1 hypothetical protein [Rhodoalgimonas zhirmunskyi]
MAILMGDASERNRDVPREVGAAEVEQAYDFDIVVDGRNAALYEKKKSGQCA